MQERIEALVNQMTLEEKVAVVAGADFWHTVPVERLGIPAIKVTDGPNGARGATSGEVPSACFPVGVALGATWNPALVERIGQALAAEVKAKGAHILLAPTVNIHRSPLAGRNFECYSEDPYLTARTAVAYITGLQNNGAGACIKHFVANDSEFERNTISSEVNERTLREIYLYPFQVAVAEARPWAVMASYNRINGVYAAENAHTLLDILKGEWGFEGIVMSDWFGTQSTVASANHGLDLEMPGPAKYMGDRLLQAVKDGQVAETILDDKARRLLRTIIVAGALDNPEIPPETTHDTPEQRALIREAAGEAVVLLKHENDVLPLDARKIRKLAVIGPNAKTARIMGGGSSHVEPYYAVTPFEGIVRRAGDIQVEYAIGCTNHKRLPPVTPTHLTPAQGEADHGLTLEYFNNADLSGAPVYTELHPRSDKMWAERAPEPVNFDGFSARASGTFAPAETGRYTFGLSGNGHCRFYLDGQLVLDRWTDAKTGDAESMAPVDLVAGQPVALTVEYCKSKRCNWANFRLGCLPPVPADSIKQAAKLAAECDAALLFVGHSDEWESEGFDRPDMELPGQQVELIEAVAAANPNTVVVLSVGAPVTMDWLDQVAAVVIAWFPGQEAGNALADVLFGDVNPSGKLPTTFPKRLEDTPAYINYPGENGQVFYGEGIFVGYRYYDRKKVAPLFPFGHGLSYTTFEYRNLQLDAAEYDPGDVIQASVDVKNTGPRAGKEVVQLYLRDVEASVARPEKELKAYQKVLLQPGETRTVTFTLGRDALAYYDTGRKGWFAEAGEFEVLVGSSSADLRATATFGLRSSALCSATRTVAARLSTHSALREILAHDGARALFEKHLGEKLNHPMLDMAMDFTVRQIASFAPEQLPGELLDQLDETLGQLE